jgi:signal transduction histidine kinase
VAVHRNPAAAVEEERRLQEALTLSSSRAAGYARALAAVLRRVCEAGDWAYGESWLASRDGSILKPGPVWPRVKAQFRPIREGSRNMGFRRGSGLAGRVLGTCEPEWVEDASAASKHVFSRPELARESGLRAVLAIPVLNGDDVLAVLLFFAARALPRDERAVRLVAASLQHLGPLLERKKVEEELRMRARQQEAVAELGLEALGGGSDIDRLVTRAIGLCTEILEVEHGEVLQLGRDRIVAHAAHAVRANEPLLVEDFAKDARFRLPDHLREREIASGVCVIIHGHHRTIGVLGAYTTRRRRFSPNDVSFLQGVANVLGTAIERHRAEKELEHHRLHLEKLVEERTAKLRESHEQLRQSERLASLGTLAAGLGHDMKNVLLPVLCRLDALEKASGTVTAEVNAVRLSLEYLRRLSRGLRLFALDPDDPEASDGVTRIEDWWREVGPLVQNAVPKEIAFSAEVAPGLPPVRVPEHRLTQAVLNLVVNAGEATAGGGSVRLRAEQEDGFVRLSVTDDGSGMTREVQGHAIEPFFTTKKRHLATGLGLSLVHGVAQAAGGSLRIDSEPGRGTTVVLALPAAEVAPAEEGDGARIASVSLRDRRATALASSLLRSAGFWVHDAPACGVLWVTDSAGDVLPYLEQGPERRAIVLGRPDGAGAHPRLPFVEMDGLHQSLRAAVMELVEAPHAG